MKNTSKKLCYCGSGSYFISCCKPYLKNTKHAPNVESLVRARFSAYCVKATKFLQRTWAPETVPDQLSQQLKSDGVKWIDLEIIGSSQQETSGWVEFKAYYTSQLQQPREKGDLKVLHEKSNFRKELNMWLYVDGEINQ